jgi:FtsP/CotA-like multicopper oxidase with cupredoxin domain
MNRTDLRVKLGAVEEWTIRNEADELHTFHIHQTPFQMVEINGVPQPPDDHRDIIDVPIGGEVKVIIPFTDPVIVGRFVYHCHILSHEDKGMMATIEVAP